MNGVVYKLCNFLPFDEQYVGKGMTNGSKLDEELFNEFKDQREKLHSIAFQIRQALEDDDVKKKIIQTEEDEQTESDSVLEGQILYRMHKVIERDPVIVNRKKQRALQSFGKLTCEACIFTFEDFYGPIGNGFIECHHRVPLSRCKVRAKTSLEDLALVCSNCHRMLHRRIDTISVEDLRMMIKYPFGPYGIYGVIEAYE